ncbi:MAG: hypothetical protein JO122_21555 [Acetobacteraceae bacterium]|nr:hypothetical protein [Acetobacteraceae bacterium]
MLRGGRTGTAELWPPVEAAYAWVFRAAKILDNETGLSSTAVRARYRGLLGALTRGTARAGDWSEALEPFHKVTRSYWPGLFVCSEAADLPRTNNGLEQLFGAQRYHERRASGRKVASPGLVVRGSVRLVAATATRLRGAVRGEDLAPSDLGRWRELRSRLERRQEARAQGHRFRHNPQEYLRRLEEALIKGILPS